MSHAARELPPGLIFEIAAQAGLRIPNAKRDRIPIRCPFHDDRHASAVLFTENVFHCAVCTPEGGMTAKEFAGRLGVAWNPPSSDWLHRPPVRTAARKAAATDAFTAADAAAVWNAARQRALDDEQCAADQPVYDYLARRGLAASWELRLFGILADDAALPSVVAWWPGAGYRIVAPLYDALGSLACVQARSINGREPKTLFPKGSRAQGTVFASSKGLALLQGHAAEQVILAEGLTDYLALSTYAHCAVLSAPGTGLARGALGSWARARTLFLALDVDAAGEGTVETVARAAFEVGADRVFRLVWPAGAKDACDALARVGPTRFEDFLEHEIGRLASAAA